MRVPRVSAAELAGEAAKVTPPAVVTGLTLFGVGLQDWVYLLTAIYTLLLIVKFVWTNWLKPIVRPRKEPEPE
jgi:hypothetical protein